MEERLQATLLLRIPADDRPIYRVYPCRKIDRPHLSSEVQVL